MRLAAYYTQEQLKELIVTGYECYIDLDFDFLCFETPYQVIRETFPAYYNIVDIGCCAGLQCAFFEDYNSYMGVDCCNFSSVWNLMSQPNATFLQQDGLSFLENNVF